MSADPAEWTKLRQRLVDEVKLEKDSLGFYFLGKNWKDRVEHVGTHVPRQSRRQVKRMFSSRTTGLHPAGPVMAYLRNHLGAKVATSQDIPLMEDGMKVEVAGLARRRQRPLAKAVFITLEPEPGHIPLVVWPGSTPACAMSWGSRSSWLRVPCPGGKRR